jgi:hypothetical protein
MEQITEIQELSLEKVIDSKLQQANVTDQILDALKEKYGGMKLKALDDKESYLELKVAARDCAKVRTLAVKVCKEGREEAVRTQKQWIATEKKVVGRVAEVEDPIDAEIALFDAEVARLDAEEKKRQEEAYINRQAILTKMGARYENGSFVLGEASFESELIKGSSIDVWEEAIIPKFQVEFEKIESVRIAEEKAKKEREEAIKADQEKLRKEQEAFKLQQEQFKKQQDEAARIEREKLQSENAEKLRKEREVEFEKMKALAAEQAESKRLADIEAAIQKEKERQAEEMRQAEIKKQQEEEKRKADMEAAKDKVKWDNFITSVKAIETFDMRSGQYRRKMQVAKEKIEEILSL